MQARLLLAAATGTLVCLSFPPHPIPSLSFVALGPLLVAISRASVGHAFLAGWVSGVAMHLGACAWVLPTIARFEHTSVLSSLPFFAAFLVYQGLFFALFAAGVRWSCQSKTNGRGAIAGCLFAASWWVLLEWRYPKIIPWFLGDTLAGAPLLRQAADLCGVYGLSVLIVFVNAALAVAINHGAAGIAVPMLPLGAAAAALVAAMIYGEVRVLHVAPSGERRVANDITVTSVQGGMRSGRDDHMVANEDAWRTYSGLTTQHSVGDADLIVWPETVLRVHLRQDDYYRRRISTLVTQAQQALFVGALDAPRFERGELNSGYLIAPKEASSAFTEPDPNPPGTDASQSDAAMPPDSGLETSMQVYHKAVLLPFGEYVPGPSWLPFLRRWQTTGQFVSGAAPRPLRVALPSEVRRKAGRSTSFAPSICFEAIWPGVFNQLVRDGAEFLINITDDGWFGNSAAPYQHLAAVTLRAVETRRWLVRASNSGVSAFVDPTGRVVASLPLGAVGVVSQRLEALRMLSPYVRWGDWLVVLCALIVTARLLGNWLL